MCSSSIKGARSRPRRSAAGRAPQRASPQRAGRRARRAPAAAPPCAPRRLPPLPDLQRNVESQREASARLRTQRMNSACANVMRQSHKSVALAVCCEDKATVHAHSGSRCAPCPWCAGRLLQSCSTRIATSFSSERSSACPAAVPVWAVNEAPRTAVGPYLAACLTRC